MNSIVREFEREYAHGQKLDHVRKFVNKYYIQGGEHIRETKENRIRTRILEKKLRLLEHLLAASN
jgi:hypothetical protein